jgi:hypothetical protein
VASCHTRETPQLKAPLAPRSNVNPNPGSGGSGSQHRISLAGVNSRHLSLKSLSHPPTFSPSRSRGAWPCLRRANLRTGAHMRSLSRCGPMRAPHERVRATHRAWDSVNGTRFSGDFIGLHNVPVTFLARASAWGTHPHACPSRDAPRVAPLLKIARVALTDRDVSPRCGAGQGLPRNVHALQLTPRTPRTFFSRLFFCSLCVSTLVEHCRLLPQK